MPPSIYIHKWLIEIQCQSHSSLTRSSKIGQCVFFASSESHIWEVIHLFLLGTIFLSVLPIPPTCFCCWWHRSLASATAVTHSYVRTAPSSLELSRTHNNQNHLCLGVHYSHDFCTLILKGIILSPTFFMHFPQGGMGAYMTFCNLLYLGTLGFLPTFLYNIPVSYFFFFRICAAHETLGLKFSCLSLPMEKRRITYRKEASQ